MTAEKPVIAYKGGNIERDLLNELELPCVDLEAFGCPKVQDLIHSGLGYEMWDCGHHNGMGTAHCAMAECQILHEWIEFKIDQLKRDEETDNVQ